MELLEQYKSLILKYKYPILIAFFGLIFFGWGLIQLLGLFGAKEEISFQGGSQSTEANSSSVKTVKNLAVDVEGALIKPGVYKLPDNSRVQDGLIAAGGLSGNADREWVEKNLNLALKLTDGAKIYIPKIGEKVQGVSNSSTDQSIGGGSSLININSASSSDLDTLSGVGPATAQKIIDGRPYNDLQELLNKKVVSSKVFEKIKDKITIY